MKCYWYYITDKCIQCFKRFGFYWLNCRPIACVPWVTNTRYFVTATPTFSIVSHIKQDIREMVMRLWIVIFSLLIWWVFSFSTYYKYYADTLKTEIKYGNKMLLSYSLGQVLPLPFHVLFIFVCTCTPVRMHIYITLNMLIMQLSVALTVCVGFSHIFHPIVCNTI
jgi:hypothetical protein